MYLYKRKRCRGEIISPYLLWGAAQEQVDSGGRKHPGYDGEVVKPVWKRLCTYGITPLYLISFRINNIRSDSIYLIW